MKKIKVNHKILKFSSVSLVVTSVVVATSVQVNDQKHVDVVSEKKLNLKNEDKH